MKDRELVNLFFQQGKQERAFQMIVQRYSQRLYWCIRKIVLNHEDADDVLQNTFIKVYKNLKNFEGRSSLFSWMYRIAINEALSYSKKQQLNYNNLDDFTNYLKADPYFEGDEAYQKLLYALKELPEKQAIIFQLKYFEDLKYDEIVEIIGGTVGSHKASYHHAVKKIEAFLTAD